MCLHLMYCMRRGGVLQCNQTVSTTRLDAWTGCPLPNDDDFSCGFVLRSARHVVFDRPMLCNPSAPNAYAWTVTRKGGDRVLETFLPVTLDGDYELCFSPANASSAGWGRHHVAVWAELANCRGLLGFIALCHEFFSRSRLRA